MVQRVALTLTLTLTLALALTLTLTLTLTQELDECRAFELLRSSYDRGNFLLSKHAKVIAMTCTHAAIKRRDLINLAFQYDNLVMEEAAQARTGVVPAAGASPGHLR